MNPATPPKNRGRGNRKWEHDVPIFERHTEARYRKVGEHEDSIDPYQQHHEEKKPDEEMSVAGFIRFATGTEKAGTKVEYDVPPFERHIGELASGSELGDPLPVGAAEHLAGTGELFERVEVQRGKGGAWNESAYEEWQFLPLLKEDTF